MTKLLDKAQFITTENPKDSISPVFRKEFSVKDKAVKATLSITARGVYEARINGKRIGEFFLAPGYTVYNKRLQVQTYDVTNLIEDKNTFDILVGNGWHYGRVGKDEYGKYYCRAVIAELDIEYSDGTVEKIITDNSWKYSKTGILFSDYYDGETYDANVEYGNWRKAIEVDGNKETLIPQEGETVKVIEEIPALNLIITPKGEKVIDFGQNITGNVIFRTVGNIGDRIVIDHAEVLDKDGNFYNENYRSAKAQIKYITDGNSENWFTPIFSFQGFRYIRLTEYPTDDIYIGDFRAAVIHSEMKRTGKFICSDPLVNKLYENTVWGQRGNYLDIPTDCPQRDERQGWTADAQIFCRAAAYHYDVKKFFKKWLHDLAATQDPNGAVKCIVPPSWGTNGYGEFSWADATTICPWEMYKAYGDISILEDQYESMKGWVDFVKNKGNTPEDWGRGHQFGDWLGLDAHEGSYHGATNDDLLATAHLKYSTEILIKAGKILGKDMSEYETLLKHISKSFIDTYINDEGLLTCDTQTAYVVALEFGMAPDRKKFAEHLAEKIRQNGNKIQTGFIGTAYIMDALTDNGFVDIAYDLLLQKDFPSWLYCVRKGATTIWEHWDGLKPDGSMWSKDMNSFNHYAYGAVAAWMYGTITGIKPDETKPGYENIKIAPKPDYRLDYAYAELETKYGTVKSGWKKTSNGYVFSVTIPQGATADISIGEICEKVGAGIYTYTVNKDSI